MQFCAAIFAGASKAKSACGGMRFSCPVCLPDNRTAGRQGFCVLLSLASPRHHWDFLIMPFLRRHSNGFQVVIDRQSTAHGYLWVVYSVVEDGLIGLTASSLNEARDR